MTYCNYLRLQSTGSRDLLGRRGTSMYSGRRRTGSKWFVSCVMCHVSFIVPCTRYQVLEYSPQPHIICIEFSNAMKFLGSALVALAVAASLPTYSEAFPVAPSKLSGLKATWQQHNASTCEKWHKTKHSHRCILVSHLINDMKPKPFLCTNRQ